MGEGREASWGNAGEPQREDGWFGQQPPAYQSWAGQQPAYQHGVPQAPVPYDIPQGAPPQDPFQQGPFQQGPFQQGPFQQAGPVPPGRVRSGHRGISRIALLAFAVIVIAAAAFGTGYAAGRKSAKEQAARLASAGHTRPAATAASDSGSARAVAMSGGEQRFVTDMQNTFSMNSDVSSASIATFGDAVCGMRKAGKKFAKTVPLAEKTWSNTSPGEAITMNRLAEHDICPAELTAQTISYVVTGSAGADVTYGPAGSDTSGAVPMNHTAALRDASYYAISAQLQGDGQVTCTIRVDGVSISTATATGGYNIASCEISQDATSGSWSDTNAG